MRTSEDGGNSQQPLISTMLLQTFTLSSRPIKARSALAASSLGRVVSDPRSNSSQPIMRLVRRAISDKVPGHTGSSSLPQFSVLRFRLLQDGNIRIRVLPFGACSSRSSFRRCPRDWPLWSAKAWYTRNAGSSNSCLILRAPPRAQTSSMPLRSSPPLGPSISRPHN
jgi:hypothetical protein